MVCTHTHSTPPTKIHLLLFQLLLRHSQCGLQLSHMGLSLGISCFILFSCFVCCFQFSVCLFSLFLGCHCKLFVCFVCVWCVVCGVWCVWCVWCMCVLCICVCVLCVLLVFYVCFCVCVSLHNPPHISPIPSPPHIPPKPPPLPPPYTP